MEAEALPIANIEEARLEDVLQELLSLGEVGAQRVQDAFPEGSSLCPKW